MVPNDIFSFRNAKVYYRPMWITSSKNCLAEAATNVWVAMDQVVVVLQPQLEYNLSLALMAHRQNAPGTEKAPLRSLPCCR